MIYRLFKYDQCDMYSKYLPLSSKLLSNLRLMIIKVVDALMNLITQSINFFRSGYEYDRL